VIEAILRFDPELFQTREGRHQVIEGVVFEGGMVNPRVNEFLWVIRQSTERQQGDPVMSAIIRNERYVVTLKIDRGANDDDVPIRSSLAVEQSLDSHDGTLV
jgi:hypothetical protein